MTNHYDIGECKINDCKNTRELYSLHCADHKLSLPSHCEPARLTPIQHQAVGRPQRKCSVEDCTNKPERGHDSCLVHLLHNSPSVKTDEDNKIEHLELVIKGLSADLIGLEDEIVHQRERTAKKCKLAFEAGSELGIGASLGRAWLQYKAEQGL